MPAPVNVKLETPTAPNWTESEASEWQTLNQHALGNPDFYPLTVKAAYVIGVVHDLCESVGILVGHPQCRDVTYLPAYGVFASGVELLGRCLNGNDGVRRLSQDLTTGFEWLVKPGSTASSDVHQLASRLLARHPVDELVDFRHFAAHGQATTRRGVSVVDYDLLGHFPLLLGAGLDRWWNDLQKDADLCNRLAQANVLRLRYWPVQKAWVMFEKDSQEHYPSITEIFQKFDWKLNK